MHQQLRTIDPPGSPNSSSRSAQVSGVSGRVLNPPSPPAPGAAPDPALFLAGTTQLPVKRGVRFSANAATPSRKSAEEARSCWTWASNSSWSAMLW